jgi:hypothetical protein
MYIQHKYPPLFQCHFDFVAMKEYLQKLLNIKETHVSNLHNR